MLSYKKIGCGICRTRACCKTFLKFIAELLYKKATEVKGEKPLVARVMHCITPEECPKAFFQWNPTGFYADGEIPFCLQKTQEWVNSQPFKGWEEGEPSSGVCLCVAQSNFCNILGAFSFRESSFFINNTNKSGFDTHKIRWVGFLIKIAFEGSSFKWLTGNYFIG